MSGLTNESRENSYKKKVEDDISECSKNFKLKTMTSCITFISLRCVLKGLITVFDTVLRGDKLVRNYSVCIGIQWQITFSKIEFYTICELHC